MKNMICLLLPMLLTTALHAQNIALPPFIKWKNNADGGESRQGSCAVIKEVK